jgi:hypothetical protein
MVLVMTERMIAWQCMGCGRIEGAQPCIGICQDRKAEFVYAADYDQLASELAQARRQLDVLTAALRQIVVTTPRGNGWERNYRALQERARQILAELAAGHSAAQIGSCDAQA